MAEVREFSFEDLDNVIALMRRNGMDFKDKPHREWRHLWENNPALSEKTAHWPMGWVLENNDKEIVGFLGNIPIRYEVKKKPLTAASISSWVVDHPYRNYSVALISNYFGQKNADLFINATANNNIAVKVFKAFKAHEAPIDSYDSVLFWIIDYHKFISGFLERNKLPFSGALTPFLAFLLGNIDRVTKRHPDANKPKKHIRPVEAFDEEFNAFWEDLRNSFKGLLCMRDAKSLNWHFKYAIDQKRVWIFVSEKENRMSGYSIFLRQDNPEIGLKRMRLVDFQVIDEDYAPLNEMLLSAMERCRKEGIHLIEAVGFNSHKTNALQKTNPHKRKLACCKFLYKTRENSLSKELENPAVWDASFFDGDASL